MHISQLKFSRIEILHLLRAWIMVSIAFAIVLNEDGLFSNKFFYYFIISSITVGAGFLLHELAHKYFAQKFGCFAEFRADNMMLILAIIMSFFGFLFAAPGAVFIFGTITVKRNGIISVAGPAMNIVLAAVFFGLTYVSDPLISEVSKYGVLINAWLAVFNMIPFANIDGAKIWRWNKAVYFFTLALAIGFMILAFLKGKVV